MARLNCRASLLSSSQERVSVQRSSSPEVPPLDFVGKTKEYNYITENEGEKGNPPLAPSEE